MTDVNFLAVAVAVVVAFIVSMVWYTVFAAAYADTHGEVPDNAEARPPAWKMLVELLRNVVLATGLAGFAAQMEIDSVPGALLLGITAWVAFPLVLWVGAIIWENTPVRLALVHGGDWLVKLMAIAVIVGAWG